MESETIKFSNKEEFLAWKLSVEKKNKSNYIVSRTSKVKSKSVTYYSCNRSGKFQSNSKSKRLLKSQGSCKLNRYCTSSMKVTEGEKFVITWFKTHYGHTPELQHIRLSNVDKSVVASKLTLGVTPSKILDSYRDQIGEDPNREDLITRKDIQNIKKAYHINISEGVKHDNDAISVDIWVKQCQEDQDSNPILFYKKQGVEDEVYGLSVADFCIIIMTNFQKSMLKKFGTNIIAVDGTHGLNNYDFELTSILVVDEFGEGIPTAFLFSNRKDGYIYELTFTIIKLNIGVVSPKTFMTDIVSTFYSAWCSVMGPVMHQLFCSWHIDRAWQTNLSKIKDKNKRSEVYKLIKFLQQNATIGEFWEYLQNCISQMLSDRDTQEFGVYFQNNYATNYEKWAYCFRKGCGINTNMRLESMHKVIKYFYLNGKKVKRLDKSLHVLLKYVRDKCVDRLIKRIKGKHTIHTKEILIRHKTASNSNFLIETDENSITKWYISTIPENKGMTYCVEKLSNESCCDLMCTECNICYHTYSCTCNDFCILNSICKHIHYIEITYFEKKKCVEVEILPSHKHSLEIKSCVNKYDALLEKFSAKVLKTMTKLMNTDKTELSEEVILQISNHLDVDKLIELPNTSTTANSFIPLKPNEPENKKPMKQLRFFSTRKQLKDRRTTCKKPSESEIVSVREGLKSNFTESYVSHSAAEDHKYII